MTERPVKCLCLRFSRSHDPRKRSCKTCYIRDYMWRYRRKPK
jgi:hypothetical protein